MDKLIIVKKKNLLLLLKNGFKLKNNLIQE